MTRIVLLSQDPVGKKMAGPGIRYFEMAKVLSKHFKVTLLTPNKSDISSPGITIKSYSHSTILNLIPQNSYLISQPQKYRVLRRLKSKNIKLISDLYAPAFIEVKEHKRYCAFHIRTLHVLNQYYLFYLQIYFADIILCANPRQKELYQKMARKMFLKKKIIDVPFGLSDKNPNFIDKDRVYKKFSNIRKTDKIILWGGGVWNWFDPLTCIKAIEIISKKRDDVKLVFMGVKHPNPKIRDLEMVNSAVDYCKENNLLNKFVFFNFDWTPYNERVDYLLSSKIGISAHFNNLETRYSFRTRILDYLWADLPMVATKGDYFAQLIKKHNLGKVVNYNDPRAMSEAIEMVLEKTCVYRENIEKVKNNFTWENNLKKLITKIRNTTDTNYQHE